MSATEDPPPAEAPAEAPAEVPHVAAKPSTAGRLDQPWPIRVTHWANVPLLAVMAASGLQILVAYPYLGPHGAPYAWWPFQGLMAPSWMRVGGWLAGARHVHFALGWFLVLNAAAYLAYEVARGEWRRRAFLPGRDLRNAVATALYYARIRKRPPPQEGLYNGLQRLGYTSAVALGAVEVLSGLAIWKPIQLRPLTALFGGYDGARTVHLLGLVALALFFAGHLLMVALHPRTLVDMITGGKRS